MPKHFVFNKKSRERTLPFPAEIYPKAREHLLRCMSVMFVEARAALAAQLLPLIAGP